MIRRRVAGQLCSFVLHCFGVAALIVAARTAHLASGTLGAAGTTRSAARTITVFSVPKESSVVPGLNPVDLGRLSDIPWSGGDSSVDIQGFRFDMRKIAERATLLFPFITPGISLDALGIAPERRTPDHLQDPFARNLMRPADRQAGRAPLRLSDKELQTLIDKAWARRERWRGFEQIIDVMEGASADEGQLPDLLHEYVVQDALQPFGDTSIPEARLWTELGIAADHVRFIAFVSQFASRHPGTRAATELLFLLDSLVQASTDAFFTLMAADVDDLEWTRATNPAAYRLIAEIKRFYRAQLEAKALTSEERLRRHFDNVRLRILTGILRSTPDGYRAGDARFLVGEILWRQGDRASAVDAWRGIDVDPTDVHVVSYRAILEALRTGPAASGRIDGILRSDHARWLLSAMDRLHQFGYRVDTY